MKVALFFVLALVTGGSSKAVGASNLCNLCVNGLQEAKVIFNDKQFQSLLSTATNLICDYVPIEDCQNWVTQQFAALDNAVETVDPASFCSQQGVCAVRTNLDDYKCNFCELLGDELKQLLTKNTTEKYILDHVKEVCVKIPLIGSECGSLIDEYGVYYLDLLMQKIDIPSICGEIGLCNPEVRRMIEATDLFQVVSKHLQDDEACEACKDGIGMVHDVIQSKDFLDLIHIAVKEVLGLINMSQYETLVDTLIDQSITEYVLPLLDPTKLCQEAGACPAAPAAPVFDLIQADLESDECDACTELLGEIKKVANDPDTTEVVNDLVGVICDNIQIPLCNTIVGNLVKEQLENIKKLDVSGTCNKLGLCADFRPLLEQIRRNSGLGDTCSECSAIADEVITLLKNEEIDELIKTGINELCTVLPISDCQETLDQYFDEIISIVKNLDGKTLCSLMGLCSTERIQLPKLGDTCSECELIANEVITLLENDQIDSLIKSAITEVCSVLPITNCEQTLDQYFDEIIAIIKTLDGKSLCSLIGLCPSTLVKPVWF